MTTLRTPTVKLASESHIDHGTPPSSEYMQACADALVSLEAVGETTEKFRWHAQRLMGHVSAMQEAHGLEPKEGSRMDREALLTHMTELVRKGIFDDWDIENDDKDWFNPNQIAYLQSTVIAHG